MNASRVLVCSTVLLACLLWMDVCLYSQIQYISRLPNSANSPASAANKSHLAAYTSAFAFAFKGMSLKLMMTDPLDNYLFGPFSEAFADLFRLDSEFLFITPNMVSYAGVVCAIIAALLVSQDSANLHRLSYVMFQLRTWLDDLDGTIARSRMGIRTHESLTGTSGYLVDGVCDAIGFAAYLLGCYIFMRTTIGRSRRKRPASRYNLQSITEVKSSPDNTNPSACIPLNVRKYHARPAHHAQPPDGPTGFSATNYEQKLDSDGRDSDDDDDDDDDHGDCDLSSEQNFHDQTDCLLAGEATWVSRKKSLLSRRSRNFSKQMIYLKRGASGRRTSMILYRYIRDKLRKNLDDRRLLLVTVAFLLQLTLSAAFWNRYILVYRDLLESPSADARQLEMKDKILKSNVMFVLVWFWRLTNGHSLMQFLLASVLLGKLWKFLNFVKWILFVEIFSLALLSELHIIDVRNFLS